MNWKWDDPRLAVDGDPPRRAAYRRLQSWYRQERLGARPGLMRGRPVGSLLDAAEVEARPDLNFLSPAIARYAHARAAEVLASGGTLDEDRLRRNMLSSMPLCFNLFGFVRDHPAASAPALAKVLDLPIAAVEEVVVEWAPREGGLGDRTAFDALVSWRAADGRCGLLGVETKYTEPFSPTVYDAASYRALTDHPESGFRSGAADHLKGPATNQLWRNALLVVDARRRGGFAFGHAVVLACAGDAGARAAIGGVRSAHRDPDALLREATLEALVASVEEEGPAREWAARFRERYLDLSPLERA